MDDSPKKSPPTSKLPRRVRLLKTLWKSLGPEQSTIEKSESDNKEETEDLTIVFEADGQIKAATLEKLVERITHDSFTSDPSILLDLLVTHKSFTTSEELLAALIRRFKEHALLALRPTSPTAPTSPSSSSPSPAHSHSTPTSPAATRSGTISAGSPKPVLQTSKSSNNIPTPPTLSSALSSSLTLLPSPPPATNTTPTFRERFGTVSGVISGSPRLTRRLPLNLSVDSINVNNTANNNNNNLNANETRDRSFSSFDGDMEDEDDDGEVPQIVPSLVHYKIYNVLRSWVDRQWYDFEPDQDSPEKSTLLASLTVFVQQTMPAAGLPELSQQLFHLISAKKFGAGEANIAITRAPPPKPLLPLPSAEMDLAKDGHSSTSPFWLYQPKELARQITIMEHAVFSKIQAHEFLNQAWSKKMAAQKAPGITAAIRQFNKLSGWAMSEILRAENLNHRVEAVIRIIDIAMNCYALNNFNTMMALLAAFHSSPIHRLKKTFEALPPREKTNLEWLSRLMANAKNYSLYREHLKKIEPPCIPYLGIYLTDLTFLDEGNSAMTGGLINFSKYRKVGGLMREVMQLKSGTYSLTLIEEVQKYIKKYEALNETQAYDVSLQLEPRAKDSKVEEEEGEIEVDGQKARPYGGDIGVISKEAWANNPSASVRAGDSNSRFVLNLAVDPIPLMVVLPGSTGPVLARVPPTCTAALAIKRFAEFFSGITEEHTLVVMPSKVTPSGYVIEDDALLKTYAAAAETMPADHVLGVYADPQPIRVAVYGQSGIDPIVMLLDYGTPLSSIVSTFQAVFKLSEDFAFFRYSLTDSSTQWLSMNRSLSEMQFSLKDHVLFLYSLPLLFLRKPNSECIKSGWLMKRSRKTNTIRKMTPIKRRWFVLIDRFLLYYKSRNDTRPVSIVSLDHHVPRLGHRKGGLCLFIERTCEVFPKPSSQALFYVLTSEDELDLRSWFRTMRKNCGLLGDEPIFGVDMEEVASRPSSKNRIPSIITKTISFLYNSALTLDGLFKKQPGSSAIVDQLKKQFDLGINVEFSPSTDPFVVASLLILYLQELPGPLTTYDLYTQFLGCGATLAPTDALAASKLRSLVSMLPLSNISVLNYLLAFLAQLASENPLGKKGVSEVFTHLILRPHQDFCGEQGTETPQNVLEKMMSLHDLIFNGLIESLNKQPASAAPKVPEMEDLLSSEVGIVIQNLIANKHLVINPVSKLDMKVHIYASNSGKNLNQLVKSSSGSPTPSVASSPSSTASSPSTPNSFEAKAPPNLALDQAPSQKPQQNTQPTTQEQKAQQVAAHAHALALAQMQAKQAIAQAQAQAQAEAQARADAMAAQVRAEAQEAAQSLNSSSARLKKDSQGQNETARARTPVNSPTPPKNDRSTTPTLEILQLNEEEQPRTPEGSSPVMSSSPSSSVMSSSPSSTGLQSNKVYGTVFGTHRMRPRSAKYSASAPVPSLPNTNPAPARAHNNTSPAAVDPATAKPQEVEVREGEGKGEKIEPEEAQPNPVEEKAKEQEIEKEKERERKIEIGKGDLKGSRGSTEMQPLSASGNNITTKRQAKAYTFFTTSTPRAPLPGEQTSVCEDCGQEQRVSDRFCAGCGRKR